MAWTTSDKATTEALNTHEDYISHETLSTDVLKQRGEYEYTDEVALSGQTIWFGITRK